MEKQTDIEITKSGGNVFADLGLPNAEEYLLKAELTRQINAIIKQRKLKQQAAAGLLGIDQPKVSALACGRLSGFSIERLLRFLVILNQDIDITIKPHVETKASRSSFSQHIHVRHAAI